MQRVLRQQDFFYLIFIFSDRRIHLDASRGGSNRDASTPGRTVDESNT